MKILMLGWELPPYNSGGLGVSCYQLCKALSLRGVDIDFVVPYKDPHPQIDFMNIIPASEYSVSQLKNNGIYDSGNFGKGSPLNLHSQQQLYIDTIRSLIRFKKYDAIHAHEWPTFKAGIVAKQLLNKPLVVHVHATEFDRSGEHYGNPVVHQIEQEALMLADQVMAVSKKTKSLIVKEYGIKADKIQVVYNSINKNDLPPLGDTNTYAYLAQMKELGYKVVVDLGRLTVQKGLTYLLQAAKLVVDKNDKVLFLLAGNGEQLDELVAMSAQLGISKNVLFTEVFVRGKAWRDAYAIGDMFIMPSVSEPFGITALEALGYGSVVLLSNQSGVGEVLKNVMKFDYWDIKTMADQILAIAQHSSLQKELLDRSSAEFNKMSWRSVAKLCHGVYQQLIPTESPA